MPNYFLYARKSTDVEDKQVLSIEGQLQELRSLAKSEGLEILTEFTESRTAKVPGRPIFNDMMSRIQRGEAQGIICWKLDRLARNPVDDGLVRWLLQQGTIQRIATPEKSYYPPDNVLLMSVEFGMANQFIRDLSSNTSRGLRQKARMGIFPGTAPVGYLNDVRAKTIVIDRKKNKAVIAAIELYAKGNSRYEDISRFLFENGVKSWHGNALHKDQIKFILTNPFYYGHFRYGGEIYEGRHTPLISKALFDKVQTIIEKRGHPQKTDKEPKPLCGLLRCGECGCMITAEEQKGHTYYRCTKKGTICSQPFIREEALSAELSDVMGQYALPHDWAAELNKMADKDEAEAIQSSAAASQATQVEILAIEKKLDILLEVRLEEAIGKEQYREQRAELLLRKKGLEEKMAELRKGHIAWLEPLRGWIKDAENLTETALTPTLSLKKSAAKKFFGSTLFLSSRSLVVTPTTLSDALRASRENFSEKALCTSLVPRAGIGPASNP